MINCGSCDGRQCRTWPRAGSRQVRGAAHDDAAVTSSAAVERNEQQLALRRRRRTHSECVQRRGSRDHRTRTAVFHRCSQVIERSGRRRRAVHARRQALPPIAPHPAPDNMKRVAKCRGLAQRDYPRRCRWVEQRDEIV